MRSVHPVSIYSYAYRQLTVDRRPDRAVHDCDGNHHDVPSTREID